MNILGISAYYHDSAACLVVDGEIVAAAQEERFSRVKHDHRFPQQAIDSCLAEGGITPGELDYVGFYDKPFLKFERLLETYMAYAPRGFRSFVEACKSGNPDSLVAFNPGVCNPIISITEYEDYAAGEVRVFRGINAF